MIRPLLATWRTVRPSLRSALGGTLVFAALLAYVLLVSAADPSVRKSPTSAETGHPQGVAYLDGTAAFTVPVDLDGYEDLTVECWARGASPEPGQFLVADKFEGGLGLAFRTDGSYMPHPSGWLSVEDVPGVHRRGYAVVEDQVDALDSDWHHYALVVYENQVRLYVDGRCVGRRSFGGRRRPSKRTLYVGARPSATDAPVKHFVGELDDVRISNVARYTRDFEPGFAPRPDEATLVLLTFDGPGRGLVRNAAGLSVGAHGRAAWTTGDGAIGSGRRDR